MPRKKVERYATILKKLQDNVRHTDSNITAGRRLTIERWVKTYMRQIEYLKDNRLEFLYNVFQDESCWSGMKLNNAMLGQKLVEEKIGEIENPFSKYNMACRYCIVDKIPQLFQEKSEFHKGRFSPDAVDSDGRPANSNNKYIRNDLLDSMESYDPVFSFWIDRESEGLKLKEYSSIEGFRGAVGLKWSEGVEYFYGRLSEKEKEKEIVSAIITLSSVQCNHNGAVILDFCLSKMNAQEKSKLLKNSELSKKDKGIYSLLSVLIRQNFFDTVQVMVPMFKNKILEDKILSPKDYALLLSSLSDKVVESPTLSTQARKIMMDLIRCGNFNSQEGKEEKAAVFFSNGIVPIKHALAGLVIDLELSSGTGSAANAKKSEILEILQFAKEFCSTTDFKNFEKSIVKNLKIVGRAGMKDDIDYDKLAEKLFYELEKEAPLLSQGGDFSGSGDPQSMLKGAGVSGFSCHRR
ncbi:hypothetical protein Wcon_01040 [Wolbachia endosymbiont of Cylisticus convexus]|uniref:hypothetical protein n=1 Tax=Wolbachia endosymbiont of Cylisticus convexus TaxID=118728 RepID=UPI000DF6F26F|nr:hypothetical protein [Wolbachia endosymbiont of Cylisticus convexus]RDD34842.1 hypothetical protein Wcon_01040 [Wolbachia endosymbiont of Cylisticus convexus]